GKKRPEDRHFPHLGDRFNQRFLGIVAAAPLPSPNKNAVRIGMESRYDFTQPFLILRWELRDILNPQNALAAKEGDGLGGLSDVFQRLRFRIQSVKIQRVRGLSKPMMHDMVNGLID